MPSTPGVLLPPGQQQLGVCPADLGVVDCRELAHQLGAKIALNQQVRPGVIAANAPITALTAQLSISSSAQV